MTTAGVPDVAATDFGDCDEPAEHFAGVPDEAAARTELPLEFLSGSDFIVASGGDCFYVDEPTGWLAVIAGYAKIGTMRGGEALLEPAEGSDMAFLRTVLRRGTLT